jgi:hypothetical protein
MYKQLYWVTMVIFWFVMVGAGYLVEQERKHLLKTIDDLRREYRALNETGERCDMHLNTCLHWQARISHDLSTLANCKESNK